jgi:hypothetical protein
MMSFHLATRRIELPQDEFGTDGVQAQARAAAIQSLKNLPHCDH